MCTKQSLVDKKKYLPEARDATHLEPLPISSPSTSVVSNVAGPHLIISVRNRMHNLLSIIIRIQ